MIIVMHKVAKMNFRDRRNSKPRILDAKYVPTRSSKTSIKGAMATCFAGARAPIAWRLNNGKAVNAEKAINPITMFTTIRIHAVRQSNFVSRAAMKREMTNAATANTVTIVSGTSTRWPQNLKRIWLVRVEARFHSRVQPETLLEAKTI